MLKPMDVTPVISEALAVLRNFAKKAGPSPIREAINVLDDAGVFAGVDEHNDYASAEEILAEAAGADTASLDPAEWGDTTREDLLRRQGPAAQALTPADRDAFNL